MFFRPIFSPERPIFTSEHFTSFLEPSWYSEFDGGFEKYFWRRGWNLVTKNVKKTYKNEQFSNYLAPPQKWPAPPQFFLSVFFDIFLVWYLLQQSWRCCSQVMTDTYFPVNTLGVTYRFNRKTRKSQVFLTWWELSSLWQLFSCLEQSIVYLWRNPEQASNFQAKSI